jgi:hypothetical protein
MSYSKVKLYIQVYPRNYLQVRLRPVHVFFSTPAGQPGFGAGSGAPSVMLAYCKHLWNSGERREALSR